MADGKKTFIIEINGIQESLNAVDSLNKQLDALEKKIDALKSKNINISASGGGNAKALDEEAKMLQQIEELHQKVAASEKAEYQELLHAKEELKEYQQIAKSLAAQDNLKSGINNTSTMMGMKAQLKDIKTAMQTLDVESDKFRQLQQEANELNTKLKEIEQGYGQFGRNVGNYAEGAYDGMKKFSIEIGGITQEFETAKKALRELKTEMQTLQYKQDKGIITEDEAERFKSLVPVVKQLESAIADAGKPLDAMLDTMQSITAIASVGQGISALLGIDDSEIEKSIQKLVALQNILQGLQTIQNQINSGEGLMGWLSKVNSMVDTFAANLLKVEKSAAAASTKVKLLAGGLKLIGGLGVAAAIIAITEAIDLLKRKQDEANRVIEEAEAEAAKAKKAIDDQRNAYVDAAAQFNNTASRLSYLRTEYQQTNDEMRKTSILKEASAEFKKLGINIKGVNDAQTMLVKNGGKIIELLRLQGDAAAIAALRMEAFKRSFNMLMENGYDARSASILAGYNKDVLELDKRLSDINPKIAELQKGLGIDREKTTKSNGKKVEDAVRQAEQNINDLRLKLMREGLHKELAQLDENNRRELEKIRKNGQKREEQEKLLAENYQKARKEILGKYNQDTQGIIDETTAKKVQSEIDKIDTSLDKLGRRMNVTFNKPVGTMDKFQEKLNKLGYTVKEYLAIESAEAKKTNIFNFMVEGDDSVLKKGLKKEAEDAFAAVILENENLKKRILDYYKDDNEIGIFELKNDPEKLREAYDKVFSELIQLTKEYGGQLDILKWSKEDENKAEVYGKTLASSLQYRTEITRGQYKKMLKEEQDFYKQRGDLQKRALTEEERVAEDDIQKKINDTLTQFDELRKLDEQTRNLDNGSAQEYYRDLMEENRDTYTEMEKEGIAYVRRLDAMYDQLNSIIDQYAERRKKIEIDTNKDIAASEDKLFTQRFRDYDEYMQKMQNDMSNLPTTNKWGFTDLKGLKKSIGEITQATTLMRQYVQTDIDQVNDDFRNGLITEEDKNRILANLSGVLNGIDEIDKQTEEKLKEAKERRKREINEMIQIIGQAATSVIQSIGEINQAAFEKQLEAIEKQTDELEKQLDKQRELTEKYKDDVDSIEDELATARGDRRQHLIDQLNAQMQAQRESLAQEKQMEKEREKLEKKREKLEYDNEIRKWNQSKLTAAINTALAISSAAINKWPIPAVPMIAAATAMGAAQMAAIIANKPRKYADGGLLQGRSHAQGGIKVLGGHAEVEGGEFVTNRRTTAQNSDLLYYINSKKKKLDLSDMIEFYSSKPKKSISGMKRMFADGGELPTLRTDIELNSRLIDTMERYAERPSVVQVVDIINKTDEVKRVQTLAGLS